MAINEECGVFGVYSPNKSDLVNIVYYGLYALQHRGQESCGIVVNQDGVFYSHKDLGLLNDVFSKDKLMSFPEANMAVGHVRYGTTGKPIAIIVNQLKLIIKKEKWLWLIMAI